MIIKFKLKIQIKSSILKNIFINAEYRYNPKQSLYENSKQNINNKFKNKFDVKSIRISNEERYKLLFDKNKKLDINSLREEYFKLKKDDKTNLVNNCKNPPIENNKGKKFISIFNVDYDYAYVLSEPIKYKLEYDVVGVLEVYDIDKWFDDICGREGTYKELISSLEKIYNLEIEYVNKKFFKNFVLNKIRDTSRDIMRIVDKFNNNVVYR